MVLGVKVGSMITWLDSFVMAGLTLYGAAAFVNTVQAKCENKVPFLLQVRSYAPSCCIRYTASAQCLVPAAVRTG